MTYPAATPTGYPDWLKQLKASIRQRQYQALRAVNRELVAERFAQWQNEEPDT